MIKKINIVNEVDPVLVRLNLKSLTMKVLNPARKTVDRNLAVKKIVSDQNLILIVYHLMKGK